MTIKRFAVVVAVCLLATAVFAASPVKPGKWEMTMQTEITGMPMKMPPFTFETCVTAEDLKDPQKAVPSDPKSKCKVSDYKIDGNTVSWTVDCPEQQAKGSGQITFTEDSYSGLMTIKIRDQEMKQKYSGKWIGECTK